MIFIMLTRLIGKEVHPAQYSVEELKTKVEEKIKTSCPNVDWVGNYVLVGSSYDYLDIFTAPNLDTALKVGNLVRAFGHASVQIWPAVEWDHFKKIISKLPDAQED